MCLAMIACLYYMAVFLGTSYYMNKYRKQLVIFPEAIKLKFRHLVREHGLKKDKEEVRDAEFEEYE